LIPLEPLKKFLRFSPNLYFEASKLYHSTPLGKRRMLKESQAVAEQLRPRLEYEGRMIRKYFNDDWTVRDGPFSGMKYAPMTSGCLVLLPKIVGSYESAIHQWVFEAINQGYETILNIGCGEGYYAVGFSVKLNASQVYAYDIDKSSRDNVAALAQLNLTTDRVHIRDLCTREALQREITDNTLIFCDIEGGEFELFRPDLTPALSRADLIIETHDVVCPGVTEALVRRFLPSHRIEVTYDGAKYADDFAALKTVPAEEHAFLLEEGRKSTQAWMRLLANRRGAIQPDPGRFWSYGDGEGS
jgi:Ribosomal protein L11 methyltransferase (PrmA)